MHRWHNERCNNDDDRTKRWYDACDDHENDYRRMRRVVIIVIISWERGIMRWIRRTPRAKVFGLRKRNEKKIYFTAPFFEAKVRYIVKFLLSLPTHPSQFQHNNRFPLRTMCGTHYVSIFILFRTEPPRISQVTIGLFLFDISGFNLFYIHICRVVVILTYIRYGGTRGPLFGPESASPPPQQQNN